MRLLKTHGWGVERSERPEMSAGEENSYSYSTEVLGYQDGILISFVVSKYWACFQRKYTVHLIIFYGVYSGRAMYTLPGNR